MWQCLLSTNSCFDTVIQHSNEPPLQIECCCCCCCCYCPQLLISQWIPTGVLYSQLCVSSITWPSSLCCYVNHWKLLPLIYISMERFVLHTHTHTIHIHTTWLSLISRLEWTAKIDWLVACYLEQSMWSKYCLCTRKCPFDHFCDSRGLYNTYVLLSSGTSCTGNALGGLLHCWLETSYSVAASAHAYSTTQVTSTDTASLTQAHKQQYTAYLWHLYWAARQQQVWEPNYIIYKKETVAAGLYSKVGLALKCL